MDNELLHLFDAYLKHEMSPEDHENFRFRLQSEPLLKQEFDEYVSIVEGVRLYEHQQLKKYLEGVRKEQDSQTTARKTPVRNLYRIAAVAALLLILLVPTFIIYRSVSLPGRLYDKYFIEDPGLPITMGVSDQQEFVSAMTEYKDGNFLNALLQFEKLLDYSPGNDTLLFYSGLCCLKTESTDKAIDYFSKIHEDSSLYYYASLYYSALALVSEKQFDDAEKLLLIVKECNDCIYKGNAIALLSEIH